MSNISGVVARVFVDDLDTAIPLYQQLAQTTTVNRFGFRDVQLAQVGPFLLLSGDTARYRDRVATILMRRPAPRRGGLRVHRDRRVAGIAQGSNSRCRTSLATGFRGPIRLTASTARSSGWVLASSLR